MIHDSRSIFTFPDILLAYFIRLGEITEQRQRAKIQREGVLLTDIYRIRAL